MPATALGRGGIAVCRHVPAAEAREFEDGVDGGFERAGVALHLGILGGAIHPPFTWAPILAYTFPMTAAAPGRTMQIHSRIR